jgi:hypothetical protein
MTTPTTPQAGQSMNEILNVLESGMISYAQSIFRDSGKTITKKEARNLVGKIGVRIVFGKDVFDKAVRPS